MKKKKVDANYPSGRSAEEEVPACGSTDLLGPHLFGGAE